MSAADWMVVRTRDGSYRSVPRRTGLGMISRGQASVAPANAAPAPVYAVEPDAPASVDPLGPHGDEYQAPVTLDAPAVTPDADGVTEEPVNVAPEPYSEAPPEPRGNASRQEWAAYAYSLGVEVSDDMSRNKIRDAAQDVAQSLDRLPQPALTGGRLETPEDEPAAERLADDEDPGTE